MSKTCNRCGVEKELLGFSPLKRGSQGVHGTCKVCRNKENTAKYLKAHPKKHGPKQSRYSHTRRWRRRHPEQARAGYVVSKAIKRGALVPEPCEMCGKGGTQAHHDDYSKPLDVTWLCRHCHWETHRIM